MKLKDFNRQLGESYGSPIKGTAVITTGGCVRINRDGMYLGHGGVADTDGDDWQLLQPAPVLGEAVKWHSPSEELPDTLYAGDRVLIVTMERERADWPVRPELVVIRAEENGWSCRDEVYDGYGPTDGVAWITEKELLKALPLPALPPEPSLREKIEALLRDSDLELQPFYQKRLADDLEALIGGSDE